MSLRISHESNNPTAAGRNKTGIISIKNALVSLIALNGIIPDLRQMNSMRIPYILAGTGSGRTAFKNSPAKDIRTIMLNCFKYFKLQSPSQRGCCMKEAQNTAGRLALTSKSGQTSGYRFFLCSASNQYFRRQSHYFCILSVS